MRASVFRFGIKARILTVALCLVMLFCLLPADLMAASDPKLSYENPASVTIDGLNVDAYPTGCSRSDLGFESKTYPSGTEITLAKIDKGADVNGDRTKKSGNINFRVYYEWEGWINKNTGELIGTVNEDGSQTFVIEAATKVAPTWTLKKYDTITYQWEGEVPAGAPDLPAGVTKFSEKDDNVYRQGDTVPLAPCRDFVVADDTGSATLYHFSGWKTEDAEIEGNSFVMPDKAVTLTGSWSSEEVYQITWQWKLGHKGPESIDLASLPAYVSKTDGRIILPDYSSDPSVPSGYTFNGWEIDGVAMASAAEVSIEQNTVIVGKWSKTYQSTYPIHTDFDFFGYYEDEEEEMRKQQEVSAYLAGQITALPEGAAITEAGEGQEVFLPQLKEKSEIAGHPYCVFIRWHVKDGEGKDIALTQTQTEDGTPTNFFIMPAGEVTVCAVIMRETVTWDAYDKNDSSVQLATIARNGMPFDETQPIHGTVNLEVYVCDTPDAGNEIKAAEVTFRFNYSTSGYGCVDLDIITKSGYRLYKVDYQACYGTSGINKTGWRSADKSIFTMDNVTDGSTAKIYLTKTYKVRYDVTLEEGVTGNVSDYLEDYQQTVTTDVFLGDIAAEVSACTQSGKGHDKCSANAASVSQASKEAFLNGYPRVTSFSTQAVSIKSDQRDDVGFSDDGSWTLKSNEKIGQGEELNVIEKGADGMRALVDSADPYVIPMSISLKAVASADNSCTYNVQYYYQNVDGKYKLQRNQSVKAENGDSVSAVIKNDDVGHYVYNDTLSESNGTASNELVLKLYFDRRQYKITFSAGNAGDVHGAVNGKTSFSADVIWQGGFPKKPNVTAAENYYFVGWKDSAGNMVSDEDFPEKVEQNATYTAVWKEKIAYITQYLFEDADSGEYKEDKNLGEAVTAYGLPNDTADASELTATLPDYYTEDSDREAEENSLSGTLSEGTTLVLKRYYTLDTVTITFLAGEHGKFNGQETDAKTLKYGASFPAVPTTSADLGWKFANKWLDGDTEIAPSDFPQYVQEDLRYIAVWEEDLVDYTTEFYFEKKQPDGSYKDVIGTEIDSSYVSVKQSEQAGQTVEAERLAEIPDAYEEDTEKTAQSALLESGRPLTLKRYYKLKEYTVTFNPGDMGTLTGGGEYKIKHGESFTEPEKNPNDGYVFDGWKDKNNEKVDSLPQTVESDLEYTAVWKEKLSDDVDYTTEFYFEDLNGNYNTGIAAAVKSTGKEGETVEAAFPNEVIPAYYQMTEHEGQLLSGTLTKNLVLKRFYKRSTYRITFAPGENGTLIGDLVFEVKHDGNFPSIPEVKPEDGYEFEGWYDENGKKILSFPEKVEEQNTYTAHWTKKLVAQDPTEPSSEATTEQDPTEPSSEATTEQDPTESSTEVPTGQDPTGTSSEATTEPKPAEPPKTGDSTPLFEIIFAVFAGGFLTFYLAWFDKKRKRKCN